MERDAALFGSFLLTFGGFQLLHYAHINAIAVVAHFPWLLWLIDRLSQGNANAPKVRAGLALLTASQLLLGYPQYVGFSLLAEGVYALLLAWEKRRYGWLGGLVLAKLLGLIAGAVQVLPTRAVLAGSWRAEPTLEFLGLFSLHPANLLQWVAPYLSETRVVSPAEPMGGGAILPPATSILDGRVKEFGLYNGSIVVPLLAWLAIRRKGTGTPERRFLAIAASILAVLAVFLALGRFSPLFSVVGPLPPFHHFRGQARAVVLLNLATSMLAALAFAELSASRFEQGRPSRRCLLVLGLAPLISVLLVVLALGFADRWEALTVTDSAVALWAGPLLALLAAMLVAWAAFGSRTALTGIILFTALDVSIYGLTYIRSGDRYDLQTLASHYPRPTTLPGERVELSPIAPLADNSWMFTGQGLVSGYVALTPLRRLDYTRPGSLQVASARYWLHPTPEALDEEPLPRARLLTAAWPSFDPNADLDRIDPAMIALIDTPLPFPLPGGPPGSAKIVEDLPGDIRITTDAPNRQLLVLSERFAEGWQVSVDGRKSRILPVYGDFLGCLVPPGTLEIRFRYRPKSLILGSWLSAIGCALIGLQLLPNPRRTQRQTQTPIRSPNLKYINKRQNQVRV